MPNRSLDKIEEETANRILRVEVRYHIIKAIYIAVVLMALAAFMAYNSNHNRTLIEQSSGKTRQMLRCALPAFTPENYKNASPIVDQCIKASQ